MARITVNMILTVSLACLVVLICIVGFYVFLKRQQTSAAISERPCIMDIPEVKTPQLAIRIPAEWRHNKIDGPGFYVHSFSSPDGEGNMTVYIGNNPSIKKEVTSRKIMKRIGGKKVEFFAAVTDQTIISQAIIKGFFDRTGNNTISALVLHVMIIARENSLTKRAFKALDTLQIVK
jgi:hypothetical protein